MKRWFAILLLAFVGLGLGTATSAEARRLGGGKSIGMQRQATPPRDAAKAPSAAPTQPAAAPARPGIGRWLAPLAAFGLGAALMSMFGGNMMAGVLGNVLMLLLLAGAVFFIVRMFRSRSAPVDRQPLQYAGLPGSVAQPASGFPAGTGLTMNDPVADSTPAATYPPGFDVEGFLRQAKVSFLRLQAANDAGDVRDIRDYTTPELYAELAMQVRERGAVAQKTDVLTLNTEILGVAEEEGRAIASVRFTGLVREEEGKGAEPVDETWHVVKDLKDRKATWLVAGIQQNG